MVSRRMVEKGIAGCRASAGPKLKEGGSVGPPSHIAPLSPLPPHHHHPSYTSRPYTFYCSRYLSPATLPAEPSCALIITPGHAGGNDLPWQGQRQLAQHLRQWNYGSLRSTVIGRDFLWRFFFLGSVWFHFLSNLGIFNILALLWKIGCTIKRKKIV